MYLASGETRTSSKGQSARPSSCLPVFQSQRISRRCSNAVVSSEYVRGISENEFPLPTVKRNGPVSRAAEANCQRMTRPERPAETRWLPSFDQARAYV